MKKNTYEYPKSSFLSIPKDTSLIMEKILNNKKILKLLYYNSRDWESKPNLTAEQIKSLFDKQQISNIPKIFIAKERLSYLRITYNNFKPNDENPFYRDHIVQFKIICTLMIGTQIIMSCDPIELQGSLMLCLMDAIFLAQESLLL